MVLTIGSLGGLVGTVGLGHEGSERVTGDRRASNVLTSVSRSSISMARALKASGICDGFSSSFPRASWTWLYIGLVSGCIKFLEFLVVGRDHVDVLLSHDLTEGRIGVAVEDRAVREFPIPAVLDPLSAVVHDELPVSVGLEWMRNLMPDIREVAEKLVFETPLHHGVQLAGKIAV